MRIFGIAITAIFLMAAPLVAGGLPEKTSGLTCTAKTGAHLRINIDPGEMRFQKEGFDVLPILSIDTKTLVLTRFANDEIRIVASLNRQSLVYTAQSTEAASGKISRTDYKCLSSGPIDFSRSEMKPAPR